MESWEKKNHFNALLGVYGNLLTPTEKSDAESYYGEDLSLSEIADNRKVSRNAVYLSIKSAEKQLESLETNLGLIEKLAHLKNKVEELSEKDYEEMKKGLRALKEELEHGI